MCRMLAPVRSCSVLLLACWGSRAGARVPVRALCSRGAARIAATTRPRSPGGARVMVRWWLRGAARAVGPRVLVLKWRCSRAGGRVLAPARWCSVLLLACWRPRAGACMAGGRAVLLACWRPPGGARVLAPAPVPTRCCSRAGAQAVLLAWWSPRGGVPTWCCSRGGARVPVPACR
ncbi:hypothetical protein GCM10027269_45820 [Kribbella endophytica]